ncbi:glycosyltransferase [Altererythrobacter xixiisoli]|uniref:Glycosyltransferase n=2 Tax=Croceibacterium xixiisoli TaxID=1476466 RepID=A0A6I4TTS8_9SPHN|nr:glycosyltransferase [Croceibacterium xixiisoli]
MLEVSSNNAFHFPNPQPVNDDGLALRDHSGASRAARAAVKGIAAMPMVPVTAANAPLTVALIGNFPPRKCGIATFTDDIVQTLARYHPEVTLRNCAIQNSTDPVAHDAMFAELLKDDRAAYADLAQAINRDQPDMVWLQHEYGIFGGPDGEYVLDLVDRIAAPLVLTLHTILRDPSPGQERIMRRLVACASQVMVMNRGGRDLLIEKYGQDPARVSVIEHGAPDHPLRLSTQAVPGTPRILMTFGLLSPGKGLETAIEALPAIVARHPEVIYRIVGVTHPNEVRHNGEAYRDSLRALADRLGVAHHIEWVDRFVDTPDLVDMLEACDIYLTPYPNLQQSTSGTLSYAVALGRAVVSTPYAHARELLGDIGGMLVEPHDPVGISAAVNELLDDPERLADLQTRTYQRGRSTVWQHFADGARNLLNQAAPHAVASLPVRPAPAHPSLTAFEALCDGTGMLQHGRGIIPDRNHGYCLDDNVRALMLVNRLYWLDDNAALRMSSPFASFLQHAWNAERQVFRNFMNYDRSWCEDEGSPDSNARAIWALGDTFENSRVAGLREWALHGFDSYAKMARDLTSPRAVCFAGLGAAAVLRVRPDHELAHQLAVRCGAMLSGLLADASRPEWVWFEDVIAYDNARLPQALIECSHVLGHSDWVDLGFDSLRWLMERQFPDGVVGGMYRPAGSDSFGKPGEFLPFDQQPLEAWATIDACVTAIRLGDRSAPWFDYATRTWQWFLGDNDRQAVLADPRTGICLDGVTRHGANGNCGAESLLAYHLAHYAYAGLRDHAEQSRGTCHVIGSAEPH